ncbi:ATP-binding protein [Bacillus sp. 31A1R]|uniref:histidine kinase n=1 Tax=Robertmurraya mangrovi TaxID=3098077 RepID=A0ABU5J5D5_9BACI|nr:ATP-binding protein [Bacillus sp. 31A1R]MDZ5474635.1 ATP-binding protein [Bacillus sp. 31A1R]
MKWLSLTLAKKLWLTITAIILITIAFSYLLSNFFYEKLYVDNVEKSLLDEGKLLAAEYDSGPLTNDLREKIEWYNTKNESEVFVVSNPRELSACLPFDIDYQTLIGPEEREQLLNGVPIKKMGYEERFDRNIMAVIVPLLDHNGLEGIIYLYIPLANISELTEDFAYMWFIAAILFGIISIYLGTILVNKLTKPLKEIKLAANRVANGDYSQRVPIYTNDEVGQLANAFNHMSESIQKEDERKKEFIANVSHELRTPISYVKGYSEALITGIVEKEEDRVKYLQLIHRESGRMTRLVGDLLDLTKLDTEEYQLIKNPIPLAQLIEDATVKYTPVLKAKNITINYDLDPDIIINGDEGRIEQVLQNIMDNAINYTDKGTVTIRLYKDQEKCVVSITDTGVGIPKEDLKNITERFYRVNKARTRQDGGSGLGLAITKKIMSLHDGKIIIHSELGKGTEVQLYFPIMEI